MSTLLMCLCLLFIAQVLPRVNTATELLDSDAAESVRTIGYSNDMIVKGIESVWNTNGKSSIVFSLL